ncbi:MAG: TetR/AcrR family transcriptional regulator [Acidobacteria bacterium]|nr:TetR/AcrR family transcriptional regulator [Acidobacteriota bacterium]
MRHPSDKRDQILKTASELICEQGYHRTSIEDIVQASGIKKGTVFHYFKSKEELGFAVLDHQYRGFADELASIFSPPGEAWEQVQEFLDLVVHHYAKNGCRGGCPFGNLALEMSDQHEGFRQKLNTIFGSWVRIVQGALERSLLDAGPRASVMATFVVASLEGAIMLARLGKDPGLLAQCVLEIKKYVWLQLEGVSGIS